jgi:hypothetical protein
MKSNGPRRHSPNPGREAGHAFIRQNRIPRTGLNIKHNSADESTPRDHLVCSRFRRGRWLLSDSSTSEALARRLATSAKHTAQSEMTATYGAICGTERSAGSSSRAPSTVDLSTTSDANMAWLLAIAADVCLTGHERTMTFVELGCGENYLAIERILKAVMSNRMALPVVIFDRLSRWLDGYVGSPEEPRLRRMIAEIRAQQLQAVPSRTQRTAASACSVSVARRSHV